MKTVIHIPKNSRVLVLDDSDARLQWFSLKLASCKTLYLCSTADNCIKTLVQSGPYDYIFLDHDLGVLDQYGKPPASCGSGEQVAKHLADSGFLGSNVVIHSWNPTGAANMAKHLKGATVIPFGQFDIQITE